MYVQYLFIPLKIVPFLIQYGKPGMQKFIICITRIACGILKAKNTRLQYVIPIAFPLQQWLQERSSMLVYMYTVFIFYCYLCYKCQSLMVILYGISDAEQNWLIEQLAMHLLNFSQVLIV